VTRKRRLNLEIVRNGNALWDYGKVGRVIRVGNQCNGDVKLVNEEFLFVMYYIGVGGITGMDR
jgi:hypothetical protein